MIFIIVPKEPNNPFYLELNSFLDNYLLGHILPKFSDKFYFSMKVAWCISFVYQFIFMFISALIIHTYLGKKGVKIIMYLGQFDSKSSRDRAAIIFFLIFMIVGCFYLSINSYAFKSYSSLTLIRTFDTFFYGHFIRACLLFLVMQIIFGIGAIFYLLVHIYYYIFCTGEFRL